MVKVEEDEDCSDTPMEETMPQDTRTTQENTVDSTVHTEQPGEEGNMDKCRNKHDNAVILCVIRSKLS